MFGDIGQGRLDEDGICVLDLDDIFSETIAAQIEYQVFLQKEGQGDIWVEEKNPRYAVIQGTPGLKFAWEIKAKQRDYEFERLEMPGAPEDTSEAYQTAYEDSFNNVYEDELNYTEGKEQLLYETA